MARNNIWLSYQKRGSTENTCLNKKLTDFKHRYMMVKSASRHFVKQRLKNYNNLSAYQRIKINCYYRALNPTLRRSESKKEQKYPQLCSKQLRTMSH